MMESAFSLMQLAKTSGKLSHLTDHKIPYISLCTDPTFGGTTASFAMLGDIICGEPGALIGFAGPRVIKETMKRLACRDVGLDCEFVMDGSTEEDILNKANDHAWKVHAIKPEEMTSEMKVKIKDSIKEY